MVWIVTHSYHYQEWDAKGKRDERKGGRKREEASKWRKGREGIITIAYHFLSSLDLITTSEEVIVTYLIEHSLSMRKPET